MNRLVVLACALLSFGVSNVWANECVLPQDFKDGVVKIEGISPTSDSTWAGSGWVHQSRSILITNHHVSAALRVSRTIWTELAFLYALPDGTPHRQWLHARTLVTDWRRDLSLLLLERPLERIRLLQTRDTPVTPGEPLATVSYASRTLQFGLANAYRGRRDIMDFVNLEGRFAIDVRGAVNRSAFARGASGGPVLDCNGLVVGTVSNAERSEDELLPKANRSPNIYAVGVEALDSLYFGLRHAGR